MSAAATFKLFELILILNADASQNKSFGRLLVAKVVLHQHLSNKPDHQKQLGLKGFAQRHLQWRVAQNWTPLPTETVSMQLD